MKLSNFAFLTDENILANLILYLKSTGLDIIGTKEVVLNGKADEAIVDFAFENSRVILTQDSNFGNILFTTNKKVFGVIFLRPGHYSENFHIQTLKSILKQEISVEPTFILVAENDGDKVKIRIRNSI